MSRQSSAVRAKASTQVTNAAHSLSGGGRERLGTDRCCCLLSCARMLPGKEPEPHQEGSCPGLSHRAYLLSELPPALPRCPENHLGGFGNRVAPGACTRAGCEVARAPEDTFTTGRGGDSSSWGSCHPHDRGQTVPGERVQLAQSVFSH